MYVLSRLKALHRWILCFMSTEDLVKTWCDFDIDVLPCQHRSSHFGERMPHFHNCCHMQDTMKSKRAAGCRLSNSSNIHTINCWSFQVIECSTEMTCEHKSPNSGIFGCPTIDFFMIFIGSCKQTLTHCWKQGSTHVITNDCTYMVTDWNDAGLLSII